MLQIRKGYHNPLTIAKKIGKASNYVATYGKIMSQKGLIDTTCPTCGSKSDYKEKR